MMMKSHINLTSSSSSEVAKMSKVISLGQRFQTSSRTVWYPPGRQTDLSQIIRMEKQPNSEKVPNPQKDKKICRSTVVFCSVFFKGPRAPLLVELKEVNLLCEFCKARVGILELEKPMRLMIWLWDDVVPGIVFHKKNYTRWVRAGKREFSGFLMFIAWNSDKVSISFLFLIFRYWEEC